MTDSPALDARRRFVGIVGAAAAVLGVAGYFTVVSLGFRGVLSDSVVPLIVASAFIQVAGLNGLFWAAWWRRADRLPKAVAVTRTTRRAVALAVASPPAVVALSLAEYAATSVVS